MRTVAEATLGQLRQWGWSLRWKCGVCGRMGRSDVERLIAAKGETYALVDRRAPCRTPACDGRVQFYAISGMRWQRLSTPAGEARWSDEDHHFRIKALRDGG